MRDVAGVWFEARAMRLGVPMLSYALVLVAGIGLSGCAETESGADGESADESSQMVGEDVQRPDDAASGDPATDSGEQGSPTDDAGPPPCAEVIAEAQNLRSPVDIIWSIDSSGSMDEEISLIEERLNIFAQFIEATGLDYRVIVIAGPQEIDNYDREHDICVPPPLSSVDACPDADGPRYRHVREYVHSFHALIEIVEHFEDYADFLRPDAAVHMVAVSDDESRLRAEQFMTQLNELGHAPFVDNLVFHSIVSDYGEDCFLGICWESACDGPYGSAASCGEEYISLSELTGGVFSDICTAEWDPIFSAIEDSVVASTRIPCAYQIPQAPEGLAVDMDTVELSFEAGDGGTVNLTQIEGEASCADASGWYFDDPGNPQSIMLCPSACGDVYGSLTITFRCDKG